MTFSLVPTTTNTIPVETPTDHTANADMSTTDTESETESATASSTDHPTRANSLISTIIPEVESYSSHYVDLATSLTTVEKGPTESMTSMTTSSTLARKRHGRSDGIQGNRSESVVPEDGN